MIKILHLSDLHIDVNSAREQRVVLNALFSDVKDQVQQQGAYDLVFFTGDLIAKGAYNAANKDLVVTQFLVPLMEASDIQPDRLFMVPGNHDVNLREQSSWIETRLSSIQSDDEATRYIQDVVSVPLANGMEGFNEILTRLGSPASCVLENNHYRAYQVDVRGYLVGIAALNSAWIAKGLPNNGDLGRLRVGRKQMDEVAEAISTAQIKLALIHHPPAWLEQKDSLNTQRQLNLQFDGVFFGHNHEPTGTLVTGTSNSCFTSNAGCLYQSRDYFNGYFSIHLHENDKSWDISAREYFESRRAFDVAPRFGPGGRATFRRTGDPATRALLAAPSDTYIDAVNEKLNSRLLPSLVSDVAPKNLSAIFVDPLLSRVSQRMLNAKPRNGASQATGGNIFIHLSDILLTFRSVIFLGSKDIGKTTILHRICQLSLDVSRGDLPPFGFYSNLDLAGDTQAALLESIGAFCGGTYRKSELVDLLKRGLVAICFDNVPSDNGRQTRAVREFCANYPKCRYFFSMYEEVDYSLSAASVPQLVGDATVIYIHPFGRKQTRLLTERWFGESSDDCAAKVDDVLALLGRLNIPRTPFLISALLWVREKGTQFSPVNQAEILDALVDGVMEKLSEAKDRSRIDATIKRHYLAALAEHLHNKAAKKISTHELERFTLEYFDSRGLPTSIAAFLESLQAKGILLETGDEVIFMFDAIRAFFLSTRLHESPALLKKALSKAHFIELGEELDYYTGRHRDQAQVLRAAAAIVQEYSESAGLPADLAQFDKIRVVDTLASDENKRRLLDSASQRPSSEQQRAILESVDENVRFQPDNNSGQRYQTSAVGQYLEALRIGSSILRNSELVSDVALKKASYSEFSQGWCRILIGVTQAIDEASPTQAHLPQAVIDRKDDPVLLLLEGLLPSDSASMAKHMKRLIMPNVIMSLAVEAIGTQKLQRIMEMNNLQRLTTVQHLFNVFLMTDLRLPKWTTQLDSLLRKHHKNRYLRELVFTKLFQIYMLGRLRTAEEEKVRGMLAEALTHMVSETKSSASNRVKTSFLSNLSKKRLTPR